MAVAPPNLRSDVYIVTSDSSAALKLDGVTGWGVLIGPMLAAP